MAFKLPELPYAKNALEPHMDTNTVEIHHGKHHNAYTTNLNNAIVGTEWDNKTIEEIFANISKLSPAIKNNSGGYYNHCLFWEVIGPNTGGKPDGSLAQAINSAFGSFDEFKTKFSNAAVTRFASGWAWLIVKDGKLEICSTPNQENPLMDIAEVKGTPILTIDVWEHAYYLKYQNRRPDFIAAWWNLVNWTAVSKKFEAAR